MISRQHEIVTLNQTFQDASQAIYAGDYSQALDLYHNILTSLPNHQATLHAIAKTYAKMKNFKLAIAYGMRALRSNPTKSLLKLDIGYWYLQHNHYDQALYILESILPLETSFRLHDYLAVIYRKLNNAEKSIHHYKQAARYANDKLQINLNSSLKILDQLKHLIQHKTLDLAELLKQLRLTMKQGFHDHTLVRHACFNLSWPHILQQNLLKAWYYYENKQPYQFWRIITQAPYWRGESLHQKSILLLPERGIGDEILFSNLLKIFDQPYQTTDVWCDPRLLPLYKRSYSHLIFHGIDRSNLPDLPKNIDYIAFLSSACYYYRTKKSDFPKNKSWLKVDRLKLSFWKRILKSYGDKPKIGIAWRSLKKRVLINDCHHYYTLIDLLPILSLEKFTFFNLQYDEPDDEITNFLNIYGIEIHQLPGLNLMDDIDGTAALLLSLDLSITPFIATHCLAGAVGSNHWVLQSPSREFNFCGQDRSPFFPHLRLFRNETMNSWQPLMERVRDALCNDLS